MDMGVQQNDRLTDGYFMNLHPSGRAGTLSRSQSFSGGGQLDGELPLAALPNHVRATCRAGSALLFDTATFHTAFPCTGAEPRRTAIIGWSVRRRSDGPSPAPAAPVAALDAAGLLDRRPALRQVLGVPDKRT